MANINLDSRQLQKIDTAANWFTNNIVLLDGEIGVESDTGKFKIGNGTSPWTELPYHEMLTTAEKTTISNLKTVATSGDAADLTGLATVATSGKAVDVSVTVEGLVADNVNAALAEIAQTASVAAQYSIEKAATADEGYVATYYLTKDGTETGARINIPKDYLVKSAELKECTTADDPVAGYVVGDKYLDWVINTVGADGNETHLYILLSDLVDTYVGSAAISIDSVTNAITLKLDTANANGLEVGEDGLKLNVATSTAAGAMSAAQAAKLDGIEEGANKYEHPTGEGNMHVPAGDATTVGKFLKYASAESGPEWAEIPAYSIATADKAGTVISSTAENQISVDTRGAMEVNKLNVSKLVQSETDTMIISGGTSSTVL